MSEPLLYLRAATHITPSQLCRGLFDFDAVQRLITMDRAGAIDGSYTIFALLSLELWCGRSLIQGYQRLTLPE